MTTMPDIAALGIGIDSRPVAEGVKELDKLTAAGGKAEGATQKLTATQRVFGRSVTDAINPLRDLLRSIDQNTGQLAAMKRAEDEAAMAARKLAQEQAAAAAEARRLAQEQADAARAAEQLAARAAALKASVDPLGASIDRVNVELAEAASLYKAGAISAEQYGAATTVLNGRLKSLHDVQEKGIGVSKRASAGLLNLTRNLTDVGVSAALGMSPFMIFVQQGPQIADAFGEIERGGLSASAAMKQLAVSTWTVLAPFAHFIVAAGTIVTFLGAGFALGARNARKATDDLTSGLKPSADQLKHMRDETERLTKGLGLSAGEVKRVADQIQHAQRPVGDLTKGLGLTEQQLERVKQKTVTFGDTFMATITVIGRHIMDGPIGQALDWLGDAWGKTLDWITDKAIGAASVIVAAFTAAAKAAGGADFGQAFNTSKSATRAGIDGFFSEITAEAAVRRRRAILKQAGPASGSTTRDRTDERTAQVAAALAQAKQEELQAQLGLTNDIVKRADIERQIAAAALAEKQAGIDKQIASIADDKGLSAAKKAELTAQLKLVQAAQARAAGLTQDLADREMEAALEAQNLQRRQEVGALLDQDAKVQADLASTAAEANAIEQKNLADRQRLDQLALETRIKRELTDQSLSQSGAKELRNAQATAQEAERLAQFRAAQVRLEQERNAAIEAALDLQRDLLDSQYSAAKTATQRVKISQQILALEQRIRALKLEEIVFSSQATMAEKAIALERLRALGDIEKNELAAAAGNAIDNFDELSRALGGMTAAFKSKDWIGAVRGLDETLAGLKKAFGPGGTFGGKVGAVAGVADMVGQAIGGTTGSAISGAASGAAAGATFGPVGAVVGGVVGLVGGIFSGAAKRKAEKQAAEQAAIQAAQQKAAEELQRAEKALTEQRNLQAQVAGLLGKSEEALSLTRKAALEALEPENRALQEYAWALQDVLDRRNAEIDLLNALGRASEATALARKLELNQTLEGLRALKQAVWDVTDAQTALDKAKATTDDWRNKLVDAYQRESSALLDTINKFGAFSKSLQDFRLSLEISTGSVSQSYAAAKGAFTDTARLAKLGNEDALGALTSVSQQFLDVSKSSSKTELDYARDVAAVKRATLDAQATATRQQDIASDQLDALNYLMDGSDGVIDGLVSLGDTTLIMKDGVFQTAANVLTVADAIGELAGAIGAQAAAQAAYNQTVATATAVLTASQGVQNPTEPASSGIPNYIAYVAANPDLAAEYSKIAGPGLAALGITDTASYGQWHWQNFGQAEGRTLPTFATGGMHAGGVRLVGENGPELENTGPARYWSADQTAAMMRGGNDNGDLIAEVRALRAEVVALRSEAKRDADANEQTSQIVLQAATGSASLNTRTA